jgi:hypothetical protein
MHNLAARPAGWPYSSFRNSVALGKYPMIWPIDGVEISAPGGWLQHASVS